MERSVRYIQLENAGFKPALCFRGRTIAHCIINDETRVRVIEIPLPEHDRANQVKYRGTWYDAAQYAISIRRIGDRKGITRRAIALLDLPPEIEEPTELPPDEPAAPSSDTALQPRVEDRRETCGANGSSGWQPKTSAAQAPRAPNPCRASQGSRSGKRTERPTSAIGPSKPVDRVEVVSRRPLCVKATLVRQLALELRMGEQELRVKLRSAGLRAPYVDLELMRRAAK